MVRDRGHARRRATRPCAADRHGRQRCARRFRRKSPKSKSSNWAREKTRPGLPIRYSSRRNSVGPKCTLRSPRLTRQFSRSSGEVAGDEQRRDTIRPRPPAAAPAPRHQFRHRERLDDIIVGADRKATYPLGFIAAGGQHDDRQGARRIPRPHPAADFEPRHAGQHPIEDNEIGRRFNEPQLRLVTALDAFDDKALGLEIVAQEQAQRGFILDHENARGATAAEFARGGALRGS